ncbi:MAG: 2-hydroxyacid dehydrogenase [Paracoccaceae bacterium]
MSGLLIAGVVPEDLHRSLEQDFELSVLQDIENLDAWLKERAVSIEYAVTNGHDGLDLALMAELPNLKLISCYGVGYEGIDVRAAAARGILVTHTPDILNEEVATTAILLMLSCYRNILTDDHYVRSGAWAKYGPAPLSRTADGQKVGILGLGRIGKALARKLTVFGAEICYHGRTRQEVAFRYYPSLVEMAQDCDVLICITPGGAGTRHLVNKDVIEALGPEGTLINVGRGSTVDEAALVHALRNGTLGWAGLDVFEDEPNVPEELLEMSNVVLLPHAGSATRETRAAVSALVSENLLLHKKEGRVLTPVPETKYLF